MVEFAVEFVENALKMKRLNCTLVTLVELNLKKFRTVEKG